MKSQIPTKVKSTKSALRTRYKEESSDDDEFFDKKPQKSIIKDEDLQQPFVYSKMNDIKTGKILNNMDQKFLNKDLINKTLQTNLSTDFNKLAKSERNFYQNDKQIILLESALIDECLMLLSGLKSSLLFQESNDDFILNKKFRIRNLNKELNECLKEIIYYSKIVMNLELFIKRCVDEINFSTQVYEAFAQCLIEYLRFFKENLNAYGSILIKKEIKFTLIDFLNKMKESHFSQFDLLNNFLTQIEADRQSQAIPHQKSTNLITQVHKYLVDSYTSRMNLNMNIKFLIWLFVRLVQPILGFIDTFIEEGVLLDTKNELGFKRNSDFQINSAEYWRNGFQFLLPSDEKSINSLNNVPMFIRIIILSSFKICKHMEIIKLLHNFNGKSDVYENFITTMKECCPFLNEINFTTDEDKIMLTTKDKNDNRLIVSETKNTLLEINFNQINELCKETSLVAKMSKNKWNIIKIENLFKTKDQNDPITIDMEEKIENTINDSLIKYVKTCSNILLEKFFQNYHIVEFFEFLHSSFLFKSNEIMFLFSKMLYETIKSSESYKEDAILNNIYFKCTNSIFTTSSSIKNELFSPNLIILQFDNEKSQAFAQLNSTMSSEHVISKRLVNFVKLKIKIKWPLNILIKETDLDVYNRVFLLLMQLKQVKYDLDSLELKEMDIKNYKKINFDYLYTKSHSTNMSDRKSILLTTSNKQSQIEFDEANVNKILLIRFQLMGFMNNLHDLIFNQLFETSDEFLKKLKKQTDIDEIIELHDKFLLRIKKECLLENKIFQNTLSKIFNEILEFCDMWRRGINYFSQAVTDEVDQVEKDLSIYFEFIYKILSSLLNKNQSHSHFQSLIAILKQMN